MNNYIKLYRDEFKNDDTFDKYASMSNVHTDSDDANCLIIFTRENEYVAINDAQLHDQMVEDLMENYELSELSAMEWIDNHGYSVVDNMWDAYSNYLEEFGGSNDQ